MENLFRIKENKLIFSTGKSIVFDHKIIQVLQKEEILIVLIGGEKGQMFNNNVYGLDIVKREIKWQINNPSEFDCPFNLIALTKTGEVGLRNWCHYDMVVNPSNGEVLLKRYNNAK
jgi:hypothetical protein